MLSHRPISVHEDAPVYARTPGRALKGRDLLQENTVQRMRSMTGKVVKQPYQTPLRDGKPSKLFTVGKGTASRPLGDKTPFPNRAAFAATPGPAGAKLAALLSQTPGHLLRPSSMRQSTRRRSSGRPNVFETPMNAGDHWNVSDTEGEVDVVEEEPEPAPTDDYDEIEYMPPTAVDVPYQPAFDMPDYALTGDQLYHTMHSFPYDDRADLYYAAERNNIRDEGLLEASGYTDNWDILRLPELEDDSPFAVPIKAAPKTVPTRPNLGRIGSATASRSLNASKATAATAGSRSEATVNARRIASTSAAASTRSTGPASNAAIGKRPMTSTATTALSTRSASNAPSRIASGTKPSPSSSRAPSTAPVTRPTTAASVRPPRVPAAPSVNRPATSMGSRGAKAAALPRSATSMATRPAQAKLQSSGRTAASTMSKPSSLPTARTGVARKPAPTDIKPAQPIPDDLVFSFDPSASNSDDFVFDV